MLNRQKSLLELVRLVGGHVDRLTLTKLAFLVRQTTASRGGESFYDFVPYQFGPFSFGLYQDAGKLVASGHLREECRHSWSLGSVPAPPVEISVGSDLTRIARRFSTHSKDELIDHIYRQFPRFTVNSTLKQLAERPPGELAVHTSGYEGKSIDEFLDSLVQSGVRHVIDVRRNPVARRYGFHRSTLARLCGYLDIQYSHVPELGIASELRSRLESAEDYRSLFERYESTTLRSEARAIDQVCEWVARSPSVLLCMEAAPACCHRARLAVPVSQKTGMPIVHLP